MPPKKEKSVEETYQKLSELEHVLHRPGMYIGSVDKNTAERWVLLNSKMVKRSLTYNPGIFKIFDEIISNSIDHSKRDDTL